MSHVFILFCYDLMPESNQPEVIFNCLSILTINAYSYFVIIYLKSCL